MQVEDMTAEELERIAAEKRGDAPETRSGFKRIAVDGVELTVDIGKLKSWKSFTIISEIEDPGLGNVTRIMKTVELVEFIAGVGRDELLSHFGGEMAEFSKVSEFCSKVIQAVGAKN